MKMSLTAQLARQYISLKSTSAQVVTALAAAARKEASHVEYATKLLLT